MHIIAAFYTWAKTVGLDGIQEARRLPGYHDEPLKGQRHGQRSVRLSRSYRAIYEERDTGQILLIAVQEVSKHEY